MPYDVPPYVDTLWRDSICYTRGGNCTARAQLGAAPFLLGREVCALLTGSQAALPVAGAAPEAAVCVSAPALSWSAVFVGHWCWSGQEVLRPRAGGTARRSHAPLR